MKKNFFKKSLIFLLTLGIFFGIRFVFAQDFGTSEVDAGLGGSLAGGDPREMVGRIINIALGLLGVVALGLITYAGFIWMTSNGNEEQIAKAKKTLTSAAIGLAIILSAWAITTFVLNQLGGATQGGSGSSICVDGSTMSCGCGGAMYCTAGTWGSCIGSDCSSGGVAGPSSCDASPNPGCQANSDICAPSDYCNDSCACVPRGSTGDSCNLNNEGGTCNASDELCGEFLSCDPDSCTCTGPPVITNISPAGGFCEDDVNVSCQNDSQCNAFCNKSTPNGAVGNLVTILGSGFGEYQEGMSRVLFSPNVLGRSPLEINPACVNTWTDNQIIISVPSGALNGEIRVSRADGLEDTSSNDYGPILPDFIVNNIVRPGLCTVSPNKGLLGEDFVYQGINLYRGKTYFGNYNNNVEALSSDFSHASGLSGRASLSNIRNGQADSFVRSLVGNNNEASNYLRIIKEPDPSDGPYIISFSPESGRAGQYVTINGSSFGANQSSSHVYFGSKEAEYNFPLICANSVWTNNQIIVKVPEGLSNGNYFIKLDIGGKTIDTNNLNPNTFRVDDSIALKTSLCKREPESGTIGTSVKLYGEYFGEENRPGLATFYNNKNSSGMISKENKADVMTVSVPEGAISGPLKVVKNNQWGNELGFSVSSCKTNDDCLGQVCCPANTYKSGRCVASSQDCLIDIPSSVFEWDFSTSYKVSEISDPSESCNTLASYYGACQTGISCPNAAGVCSPYPGGSKAVVAECDYSCASVPGCQSGLGSSICSYDNNINKCVKDGAAGTCSLPRSQKFLIAGVDYDFALTCNNDRNWQLKTNTSCPDNWERGAANICVDKNSSCDVCEIGLSCQKVGTEGRCVSETVCPSGSECEPSGEIGKPDVCLSLDDASCDCCCEIGNSARDCCAPLECEGTCGSDTSDDGAGFGVCSGCAGAGSTQVQQDAACNCEITSGQFCAIDSNSPQGYCTDCSGLKDEASCNLHSSVCCFDARTDTCRGGSGTTISDNPNHPEYGYCAYYSCDSEDSASCASEKPARLGFYKDIYACESGCASNEGDVCNIYNGLKDKCSEAPSCCYDYNSNVCQSGTQIDSGVNLGYCAYYDCGDPGANPPQDPNTCISEQKLSGRFSKLDKCISTCGNTGGGSGKDCSSSFAVSTCNFDICNYPGMTCRTESGSSATDASDCGICCCDPGNPTACQTDANPDLYCQANTGNCSGEGRGLCCGCSQDNECGNPSTIGCGSDTCCEARPEVINSMPNSGDLNVCRNAVVKINFDQVMDVGSFTSGNVLLLQQMDYGEGVCPEGSFAYKTDAISNKKGLASIIDKINLSIKGFIARVFKTNQTALANFDESKLYCASSVDVSSENMDKETSINILPKKLLAPNTNYFLVIKGDEDLNSQTGVKAVSGIGLNGKGLISGDSSTEGENLKFNNSIYKNSHIIQFKTLSDKESNSGVCAIDSVGVGPSSYLFNTTENSIDENDSDPSDPSFDTKRDGDKVFTAWAYSADKQVIKPVTGYFWRWKFELSNSDVASTQYIDGLDANRIMVKANTGVTDAETRLRATVDMTSFLGGNSQADSSCVCSDSFCSSNCLNAFSSGDNLSSSSNIYIFICNNPWPPVNKDGSWRPWIDENNCAGAIGGDNCIEFSYKFYYCRDAGQPGTFDDLPAISNEAVIRGQSNVLSCSTDGSPCAGLNTLCGADRNGDGSPDGRCVWSVLKESYFFREKVLSPAEITSITDTRIGKELLIDFKSASSEVKAYKIYYGEAGKSINNSRQVSVEDASCALVGTEYICQTKINNLENNKNYQFRISVISTNGSESILSNALVASPSDKTPPLVATNFKLEDLGDENSLRFTWDAAGADVARYRLYRGINSGLYGESYDSRDASNSIALSKSTLSTGNNYFALSALDAYGNESQKSSELNFYIE